MDEKELSNKEKLENYLLLDKNKTPFLLDDNNNGKTIMLSGAWGAGKTHFWREEIEPKLAKELKDKKKACIYVSLYGKDNLDTLKKEIYIKASSEKELLSKEVSTFGFDALSSIKDSDLKIGQALNAIGGLYNKHKSDKGIKRLKGGGIICLDDFERKSKQIDLNDLFGFISQLAIEMNCKVVIILNDDVFTGKEAEVFRNVKEKTVNKFFYFEPTIDELFESISDNVKYNDLEDYKEDILNAIKETEELNARIYIQVLDNCLEWLNAPNKTLDEKIVRVLILSTINFILNHLVFKAELIDVDENYEQHVLDIMFDINNETSRRCSHQPKMVKKLSAEIVNKNANEYEDVSKFINNDYFVENVVEQVILNIQKDEKEKHKDIYINYVKNNQNIIRSLNFLKFFKIHQGENEIEETIFNEINHFVASGILI